MDPYLQDLLDSPIDTAARASKIWLPHGKRPPAKGVKPEYHGDELPKLSSKQVRERARVALDAKKAQLLAYYARTDLSADQVAEHVKLPVEDVRKRLRDLRALSQ